MSLILTIETATDVCSVALFNNGTLVDFRENTEGKSHATLLTVFINDMLLSNKINAGQLSAVAISSGPGSYTGLRIGVSAVKGICYGADIPLIAINTLNIITIAFQNSVKLKIAPFALFCPTIDARRQEVYTAIFNTEGKMISETVALIVNEESFSDTLQSKQVYFFGNGASKCSEIIKHANATFVENIHPSARFMGTLAQKYFDENKFEDVAYFEPFYLKDFVATTPKNKVIKA